MELTNIHNLPDIIVRAVERLIAGDEDLSWADFRASNLIHSPWPLRGCAWLRVLWTLNVPCVPRRSGTHMPESMTPWSFSTG